MQPGFVSEPALHSKIQSESKHVESLWALSLDPGSTPGASTKTENPFIYRGFQTAGYTCRLHINHFVLTVASKIQMQTEKKILPTFNVYLPDDLTKDAYIHWTDRLGKRHHKKSGINRFHTGEERRAAALELVDQMKKEFVPLSPVTDKMLD